MGIQCDLLTAQVVTSTPNHSDDEGDCTGATLLSSESDETAEIGDETEDIWDEITEELEDVEADAEEDEDELK